LLLNMTTESIKDGTKTPIMENLPPQNPLLPENPLLPTEKAMEMEKRNRLKNMKIYKMIASFGICFYLSHTPIG